MSGNQSAPRGGGGGVYYNLDLSPLFWVYLHFPLKRWVHYLVAIIVTPCGHIISRGGVHYDIIRGVGYLPPQVPQTLWAQQSPSPDRDFGSKRTSGSQGLSFYRSFFGGGGLYQTIASIFLRSLNSGPAALFPPSARVAGHGDRRGGGASPRL